MINTGAVILSAKFTGEIDDRKSSSSPGSPISWIHRRRAKRYSSLLRALKMASQSETPAIETPQR
jgi:hypothetical protein